MTNDALDSVSTRDDRCGSVQVWSALNRVYGCLNPSMCHAIAVAVSVGEDPIEAGSRHVGSRLSSVEIVSVKETIRKIESVVAVENGAIALQYLDY